MNFFLLNNVQVTTIEFSQIVHGNGVIFGLVTTSSK
jgi:hypothetical protein